MMEPTAGDDEQSTVGLYEGEMPGPVWKETIFPTLYWRWEDVTFSQPQSCSTGPAVAEVKTLQKLPEAETEKNQSTVMSAAGMKIPEVVVEKPKVPEVVVDRVIEDCQHKQNEEVRRQETGSLDDSQDEPWRVLADEILKAAIEETLNAQLSQPEVDIWKSRNSNVDQKRENEKLIGVASAKLQKLELNDEGRVGSAEPRTEEVEKEASSKQKERQTEVKESPKEMDNARDLMETILHEHDEARRQALGTSETNVQEQFSPDITHNKVQDEVLRKPENISPTEIINEDVLQEDTATPTSDREYENAKKYFATNPQETETESVREMIEREEVPQEEKRTAAAVLPSETLGDLISTGSWSSGESRGEVPEQTAEVEDRESEKSKQKSWRLLEVEARNVECNIEGVKEDRPAEAEDMKDSAAGSNGKEACTGATRALEALLKEMEKLDDEAEVIKVDARVEHEDGEKPAVHDVSRMINDDLEDVIAQVSTKEVPTEPSGALNDEEDGPELESSSEKKLELFAEAATEVHRTPVSQPEEKEEAKLCVTDHNDKLIEDDSNVQNQNQVPSSADLRGGQDNVSFPDSQAVSLLGAVVVLEKSTENGIHEEPVKAAEKEAMAKELEDDRYLEKQQMELEAKINEENDKILQQPPSFVSEREEIASNSSHRDTADDLKELEQTIGICPPVPEPPQEVVPQPSQDAVQSSVSATQNEVRKAGLPDTTILPRSVQDEQTKTATDSDFMGNGTITSEGRGETSFSHFESASVAEVCSKFTADGAVETMLPELQLVPELKLGQETTPDASNVATEAKVSKLANGKHLKEQRHFSSPEVSPCNAEENTLEAEPEEASWSHSLPESEKSEEEFAADARKEFLEKLIADNKALFSELSKSPEYFAASTQQDQRELFSVTEVATPEAGAAHDCHATRLDEEGVGRESPSQEHFEVTAGDTGIVVEDRKPASKRPQKRGRGHFKAPFFDYEQFETTTGAGHTDEPNTEEKQKSKRRSRKNGRKQT